MTRILTKEDRKKNSKKNASRVILVAISIFSVYMAVKVLYIHYSGNVELEGGLMWFVANEALDAIIGAVLGIVFIDLLYQRRVEKDQEKDLAANIVSALVSKDKEDSHPRLYELYNKPAVEKALHRSIESYCGSEDLAQYFLSYIKQNCSVIKTDEVYKVKIIKEENNGIDNLMIAQSLRDTRIFKRPDSARDIKIYSFFTFGENALSHLDEKLSDNKYFMRELFCNKEYIDLLIALDSISDPTDKCQQILNLLEYKIQFSDKVHNAKKAQIHTCEFLKKGDTYLGLEIATEVPADNIIDKGIFYAEEGYIQYTAELSFKYRANLGTYNFYTVYAAPTIGAEFEMYFDKIDLNLCNTDSMTFLSFDKGEHIESVRYAPNDGKITIENNAFKFKTNRTILPRSGMSFSWTTKNIE